ncbi:uncharacterized protein J3D65DRAFT_77272 [Phyllosticta citribraziliensis]|uniref:WW domain-containing protein n=1 Tax=Phyllosticta citribraziliensis TaxID=989973 RepID=A0ABR1LDG4_9PEZI
MGFLGDLASEALSDFTHSNNSGSAAPPTASETYYENSSSSGPPGPPPQLFPPWIARWEPGAGRWLFVNEANGERTFEYPGGEPGGYYQGGGGGVGGYERGGGYYEERPREENESSGHSGMAYGAMGAVGGAAAGALLMHEGDEIAQDWDQDKARLERNVEAAPYETAEFVGEGVGSVERGADRAEDWTEQQYDDAVRDVEEFPDDMERGADATAEFVGEGVGSVERGVDDAVQDVEEFPEDVERGAEEAGEWTEQKWDGAVQDVEDIPQDVEGGVEDAAEWVGEGVGEVERFGDGVEAAYDEGEQEGYED